MNEVLIRQRFIINHSNAGKQTCKAQSLRELTALRPSGGAGLFAVILYIQLYSILLYIERYKTLSSRIGALPDAVTV